MTEESKEHPVQQPIRAIDIDSIPGVQAGYVVGRNGVTRIEPCTKSGMYADIPYVRVWKGDVCEAEFCQHNIVGVYFAEPTGRSVSELETLDSFLEEEGTLQETTERAQARVDAMRGAD